MEAPGYNSTAAPHIKMSRRKHLEAINPIPLHSVFGPSHCELSRADRFAVAAAAAWAVLYLAGSPWIDPDWTAREGLLLLREADSRHFTTIPYAFQPDLGAQRAGNASYAAVEETEAGIMRHKTLFALGVLLIELCLNATLEELRQEIRSNSLYASMGLSVPFDGLDDYKVANAYIERVYREAGDLFGYAVQRCLRCEFPGRDVTKTFQFEQFRADFFHGVVAPVQATYSLLQTLH